MKEDLLKLLENVETTSLVEELNRRKEEEVPKIIERINFDLQLLAALGSMPINVSDSDYKLSKLEMKNGLVHYREIEFY